MKKLLLFFVFAFHLCFSQVNESSLKLPALISDNMMLQQQTKVKIWGWSKSGKDISVTCSWNNKKNEAVAGNIGNAQ